MSVEDIELVGLSRGHVDGSISAGCFDASNSGLFPRIHPHLLICFPPSFSPARFTASVQPVKGTENKDASRRGLGTRPVSKCVCLR